MVTPLTDTTPNADLKPLPWRVRPDLESVPLALNDRPVWGVKDPLSLAYFELSDESFYVLNQLDGRTSVDEVCRLFQAHFQPRILSKEEFGQFLGQLVSQNLVVADAIGYGRTLVAKQNRVQSRRRWLAFTSVLAIRFRGFDPDRLLG